MPVVVPAGGDPLVRVVLRGMPRGTMDVSSDHVPVSLRPLVLGVRVDASDDPTVPPARLALDIFDLVNDRRPLATFGLTVVGAVPMSRGVLHLCRTTLPRNRSAPLLTRWVRYALSWQHARRARSRGDRLGMSASDLRCLNVYYMAPRSSRPGGIVR